LSVLRSPLSVLRLDEQRTTDNDQRTTDNESQCYSVASPALLLRRADGHSGMKLLAETYVVLDVPDPVAGRVLDMRRQAHDDFRAALPVEVTVIGSGGAGPIAPHQDLPSLTDAVRAVVESTTAIETSFGLPLRFPASDVFAFPLVPSEKIVELQTRLLAAGLACRPSAWPFVPHCTIRSRAPIREDEAAAVLRELIFFFNDTATTEIYTTDRLPQLILVERLHLNDREL